MAQKPAPRRQFGQALDEAPARSTCASARDAARRAPRRRGLRCATWPGRPPFPRALSPDEPSRLQFSVSWRPRRYGCCNASTTAHNLSSGRNVSILSNKSAQSEGTPRSTRCKSDACARLQPSRVGLHPLVVVFQESISAGVGVPLTRKMACNWSFFWCQPPRPPAAGDKGKHDLPGKQAAFCLPYAPRLLYKCPKNTPQ